MAMTMEEMEAELVRLRRDVEPVKILRRLLEEMARNDPALLSPTPKSAPAADPEAAKARARATLRQIRQSRRQG